jgi:type II secretory pathway component GspD/PulD (secretin)
MKMKYLFTLLPAILLAGDFVVTAEETAAAPGLAEIVPTNGIVLNFQDAPFSTVLNYLSAKAGFIIVYDADLKGTVSIVAKQPIGTNEIVGLLNEQLSKNNLTSILEGRTLRIMDSERAKTYALTPIKVATKPNQVGMTEKIVTEILPVSTLKPAQLVKDLESLIPKSATVTANEAGGAIIMTAPERDIHRISEIISALDSSAVSDVEVFSLRYADAKSVASELKEIFQTADSDVTRAGTRNNFGGPGGPGFGGPPGFPGGGGGGESSESSSKNGAAHAVFVSDDQMNAVVASAPPDYMRTITNVIAELDKPSEEVTEIRVFKLKHADPTEVADELANVFPSSSTSSDQNNRSMGFQFGPFGPMQNSANSSQSTRMKRQSTVSAVADKRTQSVVVTASKNSMGQIKGLIASLDEGNQGMTHVTAISLSGADPSSVQLTLAGLFQSQGSTSSSQTESALSARTQANNNNQSSATSSTTSGFGSSSRGATGSTGQ